jgi:hypothetical protein
MGKEVIGLDPDIAGHRVNNVAYLLRTRSIFPRRSAMSKPSRRGVNRWQPRPLPSRRRVSNALVWPGPRLSRIEPEPNRPLHDVASAGSVDTA